MVLVDGLPGHGLGVEGAGVVVVGVAPFLGKVGPGDGRGCCADCGGYGS